MERDRTSKATGQVDQVRERLRRRAWVFDDPRSYTAGVEEALQALADLSPASHPSPGHTSSVSSGLRSNTA